jgi:hypothetical protein
MLSDVKKTIGGCGETFGLGLFPALVRRLRFGEVSRGVLECTLRGDIRRFLALQLAAEICQMLLDIWRMRRRRSRVLSSQLPY